MNIPMIVHFICLIAYTVLAIIIIQLNYKVLLNKLASTLFFSLAVYSGTLFFIHSTLIPYETAQVLVEINFISLMVLFNAVLLFYLVFTENKKTYKSKAFTTGLILINAAVLFLQLYSPLREVSETIGIYGWQIVSTNNLSLLIFSAYALPLTLIGYVLVFFYWKNLTQSIKKDQARILLYAGLLSAIVSITFGYSPVVFGYPFPNLEDAYIMVWAIGIFYIINKYNLFMLKPDSPINNVIETLPLPVIMTDDNYKIKYLNEEALELLNYSLKEVIEKNLEDFTPDKMLVLSSLDTEFESSLIGKNGLQIPILASKSTIRNDKGVTSGIIFSAKDISKKVLKEKQLKSSEEKYRTILESTVDGVVMVELKTKEILFVNSAFTIMLGYSNEESKSLDLTDIHPENKLDFLTQEFDFLVYGEKTLASNIPCLRKDGSIIYADINTSILKIDNKEVAVSFYRDVTKKKELDEALTKVKYAQEASKDKSLFLSKISQEIKNPINSVIAKTDLLAKSEISESQKELIDLINKSSSDILELVEDITHYSNIESGRLEIEERCFSLNDLILSNLSALKPLAKDKRLEVKYNFDEKIGEFFIGDARKISQVLFTILHNAIEYTNKGKVQVETKLINFSDYNYTIEVDIIDTGVGIKKEKLATLFNDFDISDVPDKSIGFGLAISQQLLKLIEGKISVRSEFGKGSVFSIALPLVKSSESEFIVENKTSVQESFNGSKILLIVDNLSNEKYIVDGLSNQDLELNVVNNREDAIAKLTEDNYNLVIVDLQNPDNNGLDAIKDIREKFENIPIIFLTSNYLKTFYEKWYELGINQYLIKPFTYEEIQWKISQIISSDNEPVVLDSGIRTLLSSDIEYTELSNKKGSRNKGLNTLQWNYKGDKIINSVSRSFLDFYGIRRRDIEGKSIDSIINIDLFQDIDNENTTLLKTGHQIRKQKWTIDSNGKSRLLLISKIPDKVLNQIICIGIDITDQKSNQEKLSRSLKQQRFLSMISFVFTTTDEMSNKIDLALKIIGKHADLSRILVFENTNDGMNFSSKFEWCNNEIVPQKKSLYKVDYMNYPSLKKLLMEDQHIESRNIYKDLPADVVMLFERINVKSLLVVPIFTKTTFKGFVCFGECYKFKSWDKSEIDLFRTVTNLISNAYEIEATNHALRQSKINAENASIAKSHFLASMSHEIRTPMNGIVGTTRLLQNTRMSTKQQQYTNVILTSVDNLLTLINDILDFSKIEAGKIDFEEINFDIKEQLMSILNTFEYKTEEKNLKLVLDFDTNITPILIGDPLRINQVIINLVNNAIKFTHHGSIEITTKLVKQFAEKDLIEFIVKDTGIGIPQEKLKTIFDTFTQVEEGTTKKYAGTGLGLAICKQLVTLMGGEISVSSTIDVGSEFSFTIPLKQGNKEDLVIINDDEYNAINMEDVKVLLVEDNEINQFVIIETLEVNNAFVDTAENGVDAINKIKVNDYDLILMDLQMPIMGGIEATQIIRKELKKDIPIIALTANALKGVMETCLEAGMNDYVPKPFSTNEFNKKIAKHLNLPTMNTEVPKSSGNSEFVSEDLIIEDEVIDEVPLYDLSKVNEMFNGDKEKIKKLISMFLESTPDIIKLINKSVESEDVETVYKTVHKMKPSIKYLSIVALKQLVIDIEECTKVNPDIVKLRPLAKEFVDLTSKILEGLTEEVKKL